MPLFNNKNGVLSIEKQKNFPLEKDLQKLIENNLEEIFNCRFVATEFYTGSIHSGRIDTIAISEDNNPVIIEYKKEESSSLLNQSLFYLSWLEDHKGDFQIAVNEKLGNTELDWSNIRVICIAPNYKKYDLHAVKLMNKSIELWKYKNYESGLFNLEEVYVNREALPKERKINSSDNTKEEVVVKSYDRLVKKLKTNDLKALMEDVRAYTMGLSEEVEELPQKFYIAYKLAMNFLTVECFTKWIRIYFKLSLEQLEEYKEYGRDVSNIGHYGTGNFEVDIKNVDDLELVKKLIKLSYENVGG